MLLNLLNVIYLIVAIAMVAFILLQRGPGATAGSGFGAGASATVFGARGSANFLSRSTAVLAILFFALSLGMAMYVSRGGQPTQAVTDLGVMGELPTAPAVPAVDGGEVPAPAAPSADAAADEVPAPATPDAAAAEVPAAAPAEDAPAAETSPQDDASGQ